MVFLIFAGIVALVFGVLFLVSPQTIHRLSEKADRLLLAIDEKIHNLKIGIGISLILVSIMCFFVVYFLIRKY